ncbi:hypothetical protein J4476_00895 [Candidatus Woesearchaeota archaeon]|nr:MAG: hypothetical protein QT09_C0001G0056 [archaeon GW2011_AR18]MBS3161237.1 hypothetical protein [Candidatus Woesearchaeota archaeon]HIH25205.1 hypothetical protein [Nanoarchaeota archaeon]
MIISSKNDLISEIKIYHNQLGRRPTKYDSNALNYYSKKYFGSWNNLMEASGYKVKRFQTAQIPSLENPDLYYFLGLLITDGHLTQEYDSNKVCLYTSYMAELALISKLAYNLFNYKVSVRPRRYGFNKLINNEITISSKPLVDFFHNTFNVPIGDKSLIIEMPNMPSSKLFLSNLIRGIIDGDGHVPHSRHGNLKISSGSEKFLYQLKDKFSFLEINVKNPKFGSTCFELYIPKEYCSKLYEILYNNTNFYYPRKKHNWEQILNT